MLGNKVKESTNTFAGIKMHSDQNNDQNKHQYPNATANPDFPQIEKEVISRWQKENTFANSVATPAGQQNPDKEYVFYDGPPFANGLPHYGHLLCGYIKDAFGRYPTMKGKRVQRRFGWDCHGLPAEMDAEKTLGISGKLEIEKYGIEQFNSHCGEAVLKYAGEWQDYIDRQARWVDHQNPYRTMDLDYMESVLWAFKTLYNKGLIYQSMRVLPYSWACETPVSDFETKIDNAYREKQSKTVTVLFKIETASPELSRILAEAGATANTGEPSEICALVWTTTPWTLPSNLAIAVGGEIDYSLVLQKGGRCWIVAAALLEKHAAEIGFDPERDKVVQCRGSDLVGSTYAPLFDYFAEHPGAFTVLAADFVTTEDGTGIVHIAPGFGEDDYNLCVANGIKVVCPVDSQGKFVAPVDDFIGQQVFDTNDAIIIRLKEAGRWLKTEQYLHNYPHCWRTDTPLIYKAVPSWYLQVTALKEQMVKHNQQINWLPEHIRDGLFGKWLENARDWSISRNRFWGCPIPVWISDDPRYPHTEVYGSIAEIEAAFSTKITDLHRPAIDALIKPNPADPSGKSMLRRVPEILDCWFESGSMPFAQVHYPFENKEWFEQHFPADLIVEYVAQTRGWFYTMMVISTALFDRPPFRNCICHGVVLGEGGNKLSKRLKNYADPMLIFDTMGSDALRWAMLSSNALRGQEIIINQEADTVKEALRNVIKPLWSAYNFFTIYANIDQATAKFSLKPGTILDRYIISRVMAMVEEVGAAMDRYDVITACQAIEQTLEIVNNWYIRRSRDRFWETGLSPDKQQAFDTLYTVLCLICRAGAPLLPLITDAVYCGLHHNAGGVSVHLEAFPDYPEFVIDRGAIVDMERVRQACSAALHLRHEHRIRTRQPLASVTFIGVSHNGFNHELQQLILDEINVKSWINLDAQAIEEYADRRLVLNLPVLGKRMPNKTKELITAVKNGEWVIRGEEVIVAGCSLDPDCYSLQLIKKAGVEQPCQALQSQDGLVMLDSNITAELRDEGLARDVVRNIQQLRKESGFEVTTRIRVGLHSPAVEMVAALSKWQDYIAGQVLAQEITVTVAPLDPGSYQSRSQVQSEMHAEPIAVGISGVNGGKEAAGTGSGVAR